MHKSSPIACGLGRVAPVRIELVKNKELLGLFKCLLPAYHYLGFSRAVGENMKYMIFDREDRPLSCLLFGSAAWKTLPRDEFIGWDAKIRKANLHLLTNNMRFLILPWVKIPHLASHILGRVARRISSDWMDKYSHPIYMLETFVEKEHFRGTCYRAANWIYVGESKGRSRNDRYLTLKVPIKDIYLHPFGKEISKGSKVMKDKDILAVCETSLQKAVNLINAMRTILANLKERINSKLKSKKMLQIKITTPRASLITRDYQFALKGEII